MTVDNITCAEIARSSKLKFQIIFEKEASITLRIYFSGPPRDILIDGERVMMKFGETKTVFIDGQPHQLRFGAPSRELYMGDFPFKGQFGGKRFEN